MEKHEPFDIFSQLSTQRKETTIIDSNNIGERNLIFVGDKGSGKTSLINKFLNKDEHAGNVKSTQAIDYSFARMIKPNGAKEVAHIWEIGGGLNLSKLLSVQLNAKSIESSVIVLVVDLSKPENVFDSIVAWMNIIEREVSDCLKQVDEGTGKRIRKRANAIQGAVVSDRIPTVIIGNKYDKFQDMESERRKIFGKAIRFLAVINGCGLQYMAQKNDVLSKAYKNTMSNFAFNQTLTSANSNQLMLEPTNALIIPAGIDTIEQIGIPPSSSTSSTNPIELWRDAVLDRFPKTGDTEEEYNTSKKTNDESKNSTKITRSFLDQYPEPAIDEIRQLKEEELIQYRAKQERKAKEDKVIANTFKSGIMVLS